MTDRNRGYLIRNMGSHFEMTRSGDKEPFDTAIGIIDAMKRVEDDRQPWPEERMDMIGRNGNGGEHYAQAGTCQTCGLCDPERGGLHVSGCAGG